MKTRFFHPLLAALIVANAMAQDTNQKAVAQTNQTFPGASVRDGFTLRGAEVVMTRKGVTTKVERDVAFADGMRVLANGSIVRRDGSTTALRPNQLLTFDGEFRDVALTPQGVAPVTSSDLGTSVRTEAPSSPRDGISLSGANAFITRNGVTERVNSDVRLPNGMIAHSNGSVTLNNGNKITLRANQVLGLDGVLRDAPARSNPRVSKSSR